MKELVSVRYGTVHILYMGVLYIHKMTAYNNIYIYMHSQFESNLSVLSQDYNVLVRDLATTLLFLTVFLKSHSDKLRAAGKKMMEKEERKSCDTPREDISRDVNALFTAVAEIFHCWFSSPVSHASLSSSYHLIHTHHSLSFLWAQVTSSNLRTCSKMKVYL